MISLPVSTMLAVVFRRRPALPLLAALLLAACSGPDTSPTETAPAPDPRLTVYAVNYPLAYFAERIGRDHVRVILPVPAGARPSDWRPTPEVISEYRQADLILLNGAGYARWVAQTKLPNNRLVDTSRQFRDRLIRLEGPDAPPDATASRTWLDPQLALEQARAIRDALLTYRPELAAAFESHFTLLELDLLKLDADLAAAFARLDDSALLFSRPVYQYLARRYAPRARSLHWSTDAVPNAAALSELRTLLAERPANILIWDQEPYAVTVEMLEAEGVRSIAFLTGSQPPAEGDYFDLMRWNLANLARVARPGPVPDQASP